MQQFFATTYSTLQPEALAAFVAGRYGLADVRCRLIVRGVSDTYLVSSKGASAIFKIYRHGFRRPEQIRTETSLLLQLKAAGVSVAAPLMDSAGGCIQELNAVEGLRHGVLFEFAPGKVVQQLTDAKLQSVGEEMAKFHNVSATMAPDGTRWHYDPETTLFQPLEKLKSAFESIPEEYAWWQEIAAVSVKKLESLNPDRFSKGYCQFDFLPKNFHFDGDAVTFFDFDFLGYGWLAYDIMTFWQNFCLDVHYGRMTQPEADRAFGVFLQAYRAHRPVSDEELNALPLLYPGFWLFYMAFHSTHDQFYEFVRPDVLKFRTTIIRQVIARYWV